MNTTSATDLKASVLANLTHPAVRDLAWACFNPGLMNLPASMSPPVLDARRRQWLAELDQDPDALLDCLAGQRSPRLGLYFERLWYFFLSEDPAFELLAHNLPVREGGRTLGEFDLIYFCHARQRAVHLELAMKFYLGHGDYAGSTSPTRAWLGPNSHDRLDLKLDRLLGHQLRLGDTDAGRMALRELGVESHLSELHINGRLYTPLEKSLPAPVGYQNALPLHYWCHAAERESSLAKLSSLEWYAIERGQWLAPVSNPALAKPLPNEEEPLTRAIQVAGFDPDGLECLRLFIVPDRWPDR